MAIHSSIRAWRIPWTVAHHEERDVAHYEERDGLQSIGSDCHHEERDGLQSIGSDMTE